MILFRCRILLGDPVLFATTTHDFYAAANQPLTGLVLSYHLDIYVNTP